MWILIKILWTNVSQQYQRAVTMLTMISTLVYGTPTTHHSFNIIQVHSGWIHQGKIRSRWALFGWTMISFKNSSFHIYESFMLVSKCTNSSTDKLPTDEIDQDSLVGQSFIAKKTEVIQTCYKGKEACNWNAFCHYSLTHRSKPVWLSSFFPACFYMASFHYAHVWKRFKSYSWSKTNSE